ncbi:MAG: YdcF family protein [bacterium]|nr:YdcF family protein [bacterium]
MPINSDSRWQRLLRLVGLLSVLCVLLGAYTPLPNLLARALAVSSRVQPADAIVVLGASVHRDGTLSDQSLRRTVQGILLYRQGLAPLLVLSGTSYEGSPVESEVRAHLARQLGIPAKAILLEREAQTTAEEASNIARTLRQHKVQRVLLVSDALHLARAVPRFEREGLTVLPVAADGLPADTDSPDKRLSLLIHALREAVGRWLYRWGG